MKDILILLSFFSISIFSVQSQISEGGTPLSWTSSDKLHINTPEVYGMHSFNEEAMRAEDEIVNASKEAPYRFGKNFTTDISLDNSGEWTNLPNGDRLWLFAIESPGAYSMNFLFDQFNLPEGAKLYIYNEDKTYKIGAFTSNNNNPDNSLPTYPLPGAKMFIEYFEPAAVSGQGQLHINTVTHAYRDLDVIARGIGDSGSCNNNVVCAVGDNWRDEINSVAMIVVGSNGICTGALVNNTAEDGHPYFLTADHCTGSGVTNWVFRFNWQSPDCGNDNPAESSVNYQTVTGSMMLAQGGAADYALLEINNGNPIPTAYNPYYAGWDATGVNPTSQVGIHHPSGDLKKISFDNQAAGTATYGGATTWQVFNWEDGTTEPGSSGSPLFDQNHRIIGQLYGGQATCGNNVNDYYGKFDVTYPNVCNWLAPGCNTTIIDGYDPNAPSATLDLDVQSISGADQSYCADNITPSVVIRNAGTTDVTSFNLSYDIDGGNSSTINWTGTLLSGNTVTVNIPTITGIADGIHDFNTTVSSPNGLTDLNPANDSESSQFITAGTQNVNVSLEILFDNYPEETSWQIVEQTTGIIIDAGGTYGSEPDQSTLIETICLGDGCYELNFFDAFGDGMQYQGVVGNYILTDAGGNTLAEIVAGGNFGSESSHLFCIVNSDVDGSFSVDNQNVCIGTSASFTDSSTGTPTGWNWSFPGGTPSTSTDQNPVITYNTPGVYSVTLDVTNGISGDIVTITDYITVESVTYYLDSDGDGFGNDNFSQESCTPISNFVTVGGDCDDLNDQVYPGAPEICDGIDNNCNDQTDEGFTQLTYYEDLDDDTYGNTANFISSCSASGNFTALQSGDCDDTDPLVNPGATENCGDGIDNNCNEQTDENQNTYYVDADSDGYGDASNPVQACSLSPGIVADNTDCDDTRDDVYPGAIGTQEGIDNDCNNVVEDDELAAPSCLADFNGDQMVTVGDLVYVLTDYGCDSGDCLADLSGDGLTTATDVTLFLSYFGTSCSN